MKNPKSILITGASSGIGKALALQYAKAGVTLALNGRNEQRLADITKKCRAKGAEVHSKVVSVTDKKAMEEWIHQIDEKSPLDLIIANAGISGGTGGVMNGESVAQARIIFDVNIMGVLNTVEPYLNNLLAQNRTGQIALVSSMAGFRGWPSAPSYSASKGTVRFYGEALRGSLRGKNISVNVICPGFVTSRMTDANDFYMPLKMSAEKAAKIIIGNLKKNKGRICFPWPIYFMSWFISILPDFIAQKILANTPAKGSLTKD